jgi:DNA-binding CsgD family transcriptional regulator
MVASFQPCESIVRRFPEPPTSKDAHASRPACDVLWWGLTHGALSVVQSESDGQHAALRIRPRAPGTPCSFQAHAVEAFERVLLGCAQKVVASDLSIPIPSLSTMLKQVAYGMGFHCCVSRIPLGVPLLLHALRRRAPHALRVTRSSTLENEICVRVRRLEQVLGGDLSNGERDVAWYLLEGRSYAEIANRRRVSVRTVANQVASVFKKIGASGRFDLLRAAVDRAVN